MVLAKVLLDFDPMLTLVKLEPEFGYLKGKFRNLTFFAYQQ